MLREKPLVSIIIATHNVGRLIENTLQSIFNQTYKNLEVIIIDAASNDLTLTYIEKYKIYLAYFISEPDSGIYDAWNKGLDRASGEWIAFLGAGDEYLPDALQNYMNLLARLPDSVEFISSKINIVDRMGRLMYVRGKEWSWPKFLKSMTCAHVGAMHSSRFFEKYGYFDCSYRIAGDYEYLMRAKEKLNAAFLPMITVNMLGGGVSASPTILAEDRRLKVQTGDKVVWQANLEFIFNSLKQVIRRGYNYCTNRSF